MFRTALYPLVMVLLASVQAQEPTFTSNTSLVVIDVNVKDRSGNAVPDLKKSDFTILEDGKPQTISVFEFQRLDGGVAELPKVPAIKPVPTPAAPVAAPANKTQ